MTAPWKTKAAASLERFRALGAGWDGYEAGPIPGSAIDAAAAFINDLSPNVPALDVSPCADGTISVLYEDREHGRYLDLGFHDDGAVTYFVKSGLHEVDGIRPIPLSDARVVWSFLQDISPGPIR